MDMIIPIINNDDTIKDIFCHWLESISLDDRCCSFSISKEFFGESSNGSYDINAIKKIAPKRYAFVISRPVSSSDSMYIKTRAFRTAYEESLHFPEKVYFTFEINVDNDTHWREIKLLPVYTFWNEITDMLDDKPNLVTAYPETACNQMDIDLLNKLGPIKIRVLLQEEVRGLLK